MKINKKYIILLFLLLGGLLLLRNFYQTGYIWNNGGSTTRYIKVNGVDYGSITFKLIPVSNTHIQLCIYPNTKTSSCVMGTAYLVSGKLKEEFYPSITNWISKINIS